MVVFLTRAHKFCMMEINQEVINLLDSSSDDEVVWDAEADAINFEIHRNPIPQPGPRFFRGGIADLKKRERLQYQADLREQMYDDGDDDGDGPVIFGIDVPVCVSLHFYLKRPNNDFKNNTRGIGRLKALAASCFCPPIGPDIDNLAKFALDCMNGIVYADDKQVVELKLFKHRDNFNECTGNTMISVSRYFPTPAVVRRARRNAI